ncbi:MAG: DUF362 domain-containing protein [Candidatus Heimdallarchaeota archaeon]|nr:DUF362 domain-containing protein [Candidatus Heimdallarchaeota archaeon]
MKAMTRVALISTDSRSEGTIQALDLLGINPVKGKKVVLKPNFNTADPPPASTSVETLRSLIVKLKEMGCKSITLAERSGPVKTQECFEQKGMFELAKELKFNLVNLSKLPVEEFTLLTPENSYWERGFLFPNIFINAQSIVETCCLKTHQFNGHFTMSLKNATGLVPRKNLNGSSYMRELHNSKNTRKMIADINSVYTPDLIVLDGVSAFVDGGPAKGTKKEPNIILAGTDKIALDAIGVAILRILGTTLEVSEGKIFEQEQIARAVELGLGINSVNEIEIVTNTDEANKIAEKIYEQLL